MEPREGCPRPRVQRRNLNLAPVQRWCRQLWHPRLAPLFQGQESLEGGATVGVTWSYRTLSPQTQGQEKLSPTSPESEQKAEASCVSRRLFTELQAPSSLVPGREGHRRRRDLFPGEQEGTAQLTQVPKASLALPFTAGSQPGR